ncbi:hypothetical protein [Methylomonas sp. ZR1]|uniref:hypothetical protein n=1 Tax=Methylomonas sp. ZR1 TaxID=1797072 RepID=UPI001490C77A|nr:hypothetical protein [Methylomonas sp. ZR1]NOV29180.1 hypothetical protein [Methylomonas sp. ZR1]
MDNAKHILGSKTFWFNVAAAVLPLLESNLHLVRDYLPDGGYLFYMCAVSVANIYLRIITRVPVTFKE